MTITTTLNAIRKESDEIARLHDENTALRVEIDRLRSILASVRAVAQDELRWLDSQLVLRALEETP